jgi:hypothetical protein
MGDRAAKTKEPRMNSPAARHGVYLRLDDQILVLFDYGGEAIIASHSHSWLVIVVRIRRKKYGGWNMKRTTSW